ncbi:2Fe-2S iron-sulfur cluster binding domain-containing protein [Candidatus Methylospira mobilis]|uniref:2Fe-2S iron-sulfur cluster binding domain-containing protein n=1 Tax=Candidatus Methylospira mobilis TaxID=1808979 RepID=A0A5Q0BE57_9GAMM|nr:FAD-binding oxidoreductase [Candidatus Methylospira mobilis]QFY42100.1 2Fe-2S iron-sulfur cluster binding domain-containing protein [Candidatus Methylospira mobilis]WNV03110.1 FAD-binding oxidoreductase [Candidatus Methylospira mobilis]
MATIRYGDDAFELTQDESVLDGLTRRGISIPSGCRSGICQTCMMRALHGIPPAAAQQDLTGHQRQQGCFLSCICYPQHSMLVALPDDAHARLSATVARVERLNADIMQVTLHCQADLRYRPGQFINLHRNETLSRSYSLASVPELDDGLHLHVKRIAHGKVSAWVHEELEPGQQIEIQGAMGDCYYTPDDKHQALLLVGTGSGLAPLYGIVRDALHQGHRGEIRLYHGSRGIGGLYLLDELRALQEQYANFSYFPCLSQQTLSGFRSGRAHDLALADQPDLKSWKVFLCGHPDMVNSARKKSFLAGAAFQDIHADAFVVAQ